MSTRTLWLASLAMWAAPAIAAADVSVSLRSGYVFDDAGNNITEQFLADERIPQTSALGLGVVYSFPEADNLHDWSVGVGGLWGRGNENYRDIDIARQEGEVFVQRTVSGVFTAFLGYRYEHMTADTVGGGRTVSPSPDIPIGGPADLIFSQSSLSRSSIRLGVGMDVTTGRNASTSHSHIVSSFAAVAANERNTGLFNLDLDPGVGVSAQTFRVEKDDAWRFGPELQAGYRWVVNPRVALEVRYRGTFLFDKLGSDAHVSAAHGLTLSVGYRFGRD